MPADSGVTFTHVSFTLPSRSSESKTSPILQDISLRLEPGSTTALLGRSGSGKTTLLRCVNGLVLPTEGQVDSLGVRLDAASEGRKLLDLRQAIGYVIQDSGLFPHMAIGRNIALPLELLGRDRSDRERRAAELLETVGLSSGEFMNRYPHQLSGGQRQRVGLARALVSSPKLLLLDEPFGALDPLTRAEMQTMLRDLLARLSITALVVTHDLQEAMFVARRVLFMEHGRIYADLPSSDVTQSNDPGVMAYLQAANRFEPAFSA